MKSIKFFGLVFAVCVAAFMITGCQKENTVLRARFSQFAGNGKISMNNLSPVWGGNEEVNVNGTNCTVRGSGNSVQLTVPSAAAYNAVFPAEFMGESLTQMTLPRVQNYKVDAAGNQLIMSPMGAFCNNNSGSLVFTPMCSLLAINCTNSFSGTTLVIDSVLVVASAAPLRGSASIESLTTDDRYVKMNAAYSEMRNDRVSLCRFSTDGATPVSLNITLAPGASKVVYAFIPAITVENKFTISFFGHNDGESVEHEYVMSQSNQYAGTIAKGLLANVPFTMSADNQHDVVAFDEGALSGEFSVSATKKVRFSKGNLQYQASTDTWRFAEHQYDIIGADNTNISDTYDGWIDLFGWATSGINSSNNIPGGKAPYYYGPSDSYYAWNGGVDISGTDGDWGRYNSISNGGNRPGIWRTLTQPEWDSLFNRSGKWGQASIIVNDNGYSVKGVVLIPDTWTLPSDCSFNLGSADGFSTNIYSLSNWQLMEANGAVFLPVTGCRNEREYRPILNSRSGEVEGIYWTSTVSQESDVQGCIVRVKKGTIASNGIVTSGSGSSTNFHRGLAVRLCLDVR